MSYWPIMNVTYPILNLRTALMEGPHWRVLYAYNHVLIYSIDTFYKWENNTIYLMHSDYTKNQHTVTLFSGYIRSSHVLET